MEFNIILTKEDIYKAQVLCSKNLYKKNFSLHIINILISAVVLITAALIGMLVVSLAFSDISKHSVIYAYAISSAILLLGMSFVVTFMPKYYRNKNELLITETHKYTISADTIRDDTEYSAVETKIKGVEFCIEDSKFYVIGVPHQTYIFPKREIEKLSEKDELVQWLNGLKKETEQLALANRSKHYRHL